MPSESKQNNINVVAKDACTGCGACFNACPTGAIAMRHDSNGFLAPVINLDSCVDCGKCLKSCPVQNPVYANSPTPECYAAMAADETIRKKSSSGGLFSLLALEILKDGGAVCGAAFNKDFLVEHVIIEEEAGLEKLRGSKYLQSDTKKVYAEIQERLKKGQKVLFCGCPCQTAALNVLYPEGDDNLFTIDLMCHGGPSPLLFKKYLRENYSDKEIKSFSFRDKSVFGWSTEANIYFEDGSSKHTHRNQDEYYSAFIPCLSTRDACGTCKFAKLPRQGDITLADFWGVSKYNKSFDDGGGTSLVIINSLKGEALYNRIIKDLRLNESVPLDYVLKLGQPFDAPFRLHPEHGRFFEIARSNPLSKAMNYVRYRKFDAAILGVWFGLNYGSVLTYNALQKKLRDFGLSVLMIDKPGAKADDPSFGQNHARRFAKEHFHISKVYQYKELKNLNNHADSFIIGSDQVWNYGISRNFGKAFYLDFVAQEKKKIAYAASFGHAIDFASPQQRAIISGLMRRFDAISVREDTGVEICERDYHVKATHVLDPIFLYDSSYYGELAARSKIKTDFPYLLAYILDMTEDKKNMIADLSSSLGLKPLILLVDAYGCDSVANKKILNEGFDFLQNVEVYDFVNSFKNAAYVLTDSFHGMCFSVIFKRLFLALVNRKRGINRFESLARLLDLNDRLIKENDYAYAKEAYDNVVDYKKVNEKLASERKRCSSWLSNAIFAPKVVERFTCYPTIEVFDGAKLALR